MFHINLGQIARVIGGRLLRGNPNTLVQGAVYLSTKYLSSSKIFFFGTKYMSKKVTLDSLRSSQSAGIITTSTYQHRIPKHHPVIVVSNIDVALWKLAFYQRSRIKALVVGITGSQGKTTTKEMLASVFMRKFYTYKSSANNNVAKYTPSHMFYLNDKHQAVVLEMGMSSFGNIYSQCLCAKPTIGVVTNVGEAHCGNLGNSVHNVAKAKQELINGLHPKGILVINADDPGSRNLSVSNFKGILLTIGIKNSATVQAGKIRFGMDGMHFMVGKDQYFIKSWGKHNVYNALAVIAVAKALRIPYHMIRQGLATYHPPYMRLQRLRGVSGHLLINDAYNANPSSMIAGLEVLKKVSQKSTSVAVLGDIYELGNYTVPGHARVGKFVGISKPDYLITIGSKASIIARVAAQNGMPASRIFSCRTQPEALQFIRKHVPARSVIYFKASRKVGLEWMIKQLRA